MADTLLLRLSAPLQSWGSESMYDTRETDPMPTKSGVIGMIAAALGRRRDDSLEDLRELKFGVRVDLPGIRQNDFQITHMGEKLNSNLSNRVYLNDAVFLVGLETGDVSFLREIENALKNPRYSLFLGRRSCPPAQPLVLGIRGRELYRSLYEEPWLVPEWRRKSLFYHSDKLYLRIVMDSTESPAVKKDVPLSFSPFRREYAYRYQKEMPARMISKEETLSLSTEQDPMSELR